MSEYGNINLLAVKIVEHAVRDYKLVKTHSNNSREKRNLVEFFNSQWFETLVDSSTDLNFKEVRGWILEL